MATWARYLRKVKHYISDCDRARVLFTVESNALTTARVQRACLKSHGRPRTPEGPWATIWRRQNVR